jgi:hypothetical protein
MLDDVRETLRKVQDTGGGSAVGLSMAQLAAPFDTRPATDPSDSSQGAHCTAVGVQ